jgi:vacuolar-type H+-ATPase subunit D/Vma8
MARRRTRGHTVKVSQAWLDQVASYKTHSGKTLKQLGEELAVLLKAPRPVNPTSVFEYMQGKSTTREMTEAFAAIMGVAIPDFDNDDDPELSTWTDLGRRLRAHTPDKFQREMDALRRLVEALEAHATRR